MLRQITFFTVYQVLKVCTGFCKVSNARANMWNKMKEEKAKIKNLKPSSRKGFKKNEDA